MRRKVLLGVLLVIVLGWAVWWAIVQVRAWCHFRAAEAALARDDPRAAWPNSMPTAEIGAGAADLKFDVKSACK